MKAVKFRQRFIPEILSGAKNTTWRLFDDKDLSIGDEIELVEKETLNKFGEARITSVAEKNINELSKDELVDHGYESLEEMIASHMVYYGDKVGGKTKVKIIEFELKK